MFSIVFADLMGPQKIDRLKEAAKSEISVRGYNINQVKVAPELKNDSWFLPINEIVSLYCPTNRYSYLKKYVSGAKIQLTWDIFKGRIIDNLYKDLYDEFIKHLDNSKLSNLFLKEYLEEFKDKSIDKLKKDIEKDKPKMLKAPNQQEINNFIKNIENMMRFEIELCSAIVDNRISIKEDINLNSEVKLLFPFVFKSKINAFDLGFSGGLEPDFIYKQMVVGEIKSGDWQDFFNLSCAAYALAYEFENNRNLDLGVILCPIFHKKRTVPLYYKSEIKIINDTYRKTVLLLRDRKISLMKEKRDPGIPKTKDDCPDGCGYLNYCWEKNGKK